MKNRKLKEKKIQFKILTLTTYTHTNILTLKYQRDKPLCSTTV